MSELQVAVIGTGAMGSALIAGWLDSGLLQPDQIVAHDLVSERLDQLAEQSGIRVSRSSESAVEQANVVVLAVKPLDVPAALREAYGRRLSASSEPPLLLSIAAGVPLATLESSLKSTPVIRVMPNTPALVGQGAAAFCRGRHATAEHAKIASRLLGAVGRVYEVKEALMNAVTGLSGSGPAYVYVMIEALADGGVRCGLPRDVALPLAAQTVLGAAAMVLATGDHPGLLKDRVCSPGGTTIAGLSVLETGGLRGTLIEAVTAATRRADEMG